MTVQEILQQAKDLIREQGWCQGDYQKTTPNGQTTYCSIGALRKVTDYNADLNYRAYMDARQHLLKTIQKTSGKPWQKIHQWNDHHETTKADVVAMFDQALRDATQELTPT